MMKKFNENQECILQMAKYEKLPLGNFVDPDFTEEEMLAILEGLRVNVDVSMYAKKEYNYLQMHLLKELLEIDFKDLDLLTHNITFSKMTVITKYINDGHDPKPYLEKGLTTAQLDVLLNILNQENSEELLKYAEYSNYNICVMKSLMLMNLKGMNIKKLIDEGRLNLGGIASTFQPKQAAIIEKSMSRGLNLINYATPNMTPEQLEVIEMSLKKDINPEVFASALYSCEQMQYILKCLENGKDVKYILKPDLNVSEMEMIING